MESSAIDFLEGLTSGEGGDPELHVLQFSSEIVASAEKVCKELLWLHDNKKLMVLDYTESHRLSSGFDSARTRAILEEMKTVKVKKLFNYIEEEAKHSIVNVWVVHYLGNGFHRYHRDLGFRGTHRWVISLACKGKEFWMKPSKKSEVEAGLLLRHASAVIMSEKASGFKSTVEHAGLGSADGSWAIIIETVPQII